MIYLGGLLHVLVTLDDGTRLTAAVPNRGASHDAPAWRAGDAITAAWRRADARPLEG